MDPPIDTADIKQQAVTKVSDVFGGFNSCFAMAIGSYHFIVAMVAAWVSREQATVIEYQRIECRERLGGLLRYYHFQAA